MNRVMLLGTVDVPLPPRQALALFTPAGEREWVPGWEPRFPAGGDTARGTVFLTHAQTVWVVVDATADSVHYARVTPGVYAGTVEVRCEAAGSHTRAHVAYDLTALGDAAALARFAAGYDAMLGDWERLIAAALDARAA